MVACYDDDSKEPPLVGETTIDLTEALSKGEIDGMPEPVNVTPDSDTRVP